MRPGVRQLFIRACAHHANAVKPLVLSTSSAGFGEQRF
jgi:hypothetical protein